MIAILLGRPGTRRTQDRFPSGIEDQHGDQVDPSELLWGGDGDPWVGVEYEPIREHGEAQDSAPDLANALKELGLGVDPWPTDDEIRKAWRRRVIAAHPDQGGSEAELRRVMDAKELLLLRR